MKKRSKKLKVIVVMPAYNAEKTIIKTFKDIPRGVASEIILVDDASTDNTIAVAKKLGITVVSHKKNKGYGGNQKTCYQEALKRGADIVVMLHPDYQYDATRLGELIKPIIDGRYDVMFGSRIRTRHEALAGGMPKIKYFLNRALTPIENMILGVNFSEHLSGFRAYSRKVLETLPFETFSDDFVFDQQFMISAISYRFLVSEIPVPVRYFDEASSIQFLKGSKFLLQTFYALLRFILHHANAYYSVWYRKPERKKRPIAILPFLLIFIVTFLAYGQTAGMYFWQDDSALIFKLQHQAEAAGSFGSGILGRDSPYRYLVTPFVPLFPLFHLEPRGYFFVGILLYFLSAVSVYLLAKQLTKNNLVSLMAGLIYSSGYIGSDTMWRIINSYQTSLTVMLICFALIMYHRFIEKKGVLSFIFALLAFLATIEFGYVRGHGVVLFIIGMELLYNFSWLYSPLRLIPFIGLFYRWYISGNASSQHGSVLIQKLIHGNVVPMIIYLQTLQNLFIPDWITFPFGLFLLILVFCLIWKRSRLLLFSLVLMLGNYVVYFVQYQDQSFATTHRYLVPSFIGLSIFLAVFLSLVIKNKKFYVFGVILIMLFYLIQVNINEFQIVTTRSIPTRKFYTALKQQVLYFPKGSLVYFDIKGDGKSQTEFGNFFGVGSMPDSTALAIYYGIDRYDISMPSTFDEFLFMIKKSHTTSQHVFTFSYDANSGLKDTTAITRKQLFGNKTEMTIANPEMIYQNVQVPFTVDLNIAINKPDIPVTKAGTDGNLAKYLNYFMAKDQYYNAVRATASSEWKDNEIDQIADKNVETNWMANRMDWHYKERESITMNLGESRTIGAVILTTGAAVRTPTAYTYYCSGDNTHFQKIKDVTVTRVADNQILFDRFNPVTCQYVLIDIKKSYGGDAPQLAEVEVVDSQFADIDLTKADAIKSNPLAFVYGEQDQQALLDYFNSTGYPINVCINTNEQASIDDVVCKFIQTNGGNTSVTFPQTGSVLKRIFVRSLPGINATITSATITPLTLKDLEEKNMIRTIAEN